MLLMAFTVFLLSSFLLTADLGVAHYFSTTPFFAITGLTIALSCLKEYRFLACIPLLATLSESTIFYDSNWMAIAWIFPPMLTYFLTNRMLNPLFIAPLGVFTTLLFHQLIRLCLGSTFQSLSLIVTQFLLIVVISLLFLKWNSSLK